MGWIRINNRRNFLLKKIPAYHPASMKYISFWKAEKKKIIEGYWGPDDENIKNYDVHENSYNIKTDKWRFMPPQLYFYVNYGTILHNEEGAPKTAPKRKIKPSLRDVEWEFFYNWIEARGFSGFSGDDEFTCNRDVKEYESGEDVILDSSCYNSDGEVKKFVPAREYIRRLFKKPMGTPLYMNEAKNLFMLGSRGFGKDLYEETIVITPEGEKKIKDVVVGDKVVGPDGLPTTVIDRFDYNDQEQFEIEFRDGRKAISGLGHIWTVYERLDNGEFVKRDLELREIKRRLISKQYNANFYIKEIAPIKRDEKHFEIDPYIAGFLYVAGNKLLGGATVRLKNGRLTRKELEARMAEGYKISAETDGVRYRYYIISPTDDNIYLRYIERILNPQKRIFPDEYIYGSEDQRFAFIRGVVDASKIELVHDRYLSFFPDSNIDVDKIASIMRSCGLITFPKDGFTFFGVSNFDKRMTSLDFSEAEVVLRKKSTYGLIGFRSIKSIGIKKSVCLAVDNSSNQFLINDYIPTHNSYMVGIGVVLHELITDGAKIYTPETIQNPATVEIFVGAGLSSKSSDILSKTVLAFKNMPGTWMKDTEEEIPNPLFKEMAGSLEPNNMKNPWRHEYLVKVNGRWKTKGTGSNIKHGVYTIDNPEAAAGTRPGVMVIEEVGLLGNVLTVHSSNEYCQVEGTVKFGSSVYLGTSGSMEKIVETEIIFRDPESYSFLSFDDEWEGKGKIGWFVSAEYGLNQFKDENGNTDVKRARAYLEKIRLKKKKAKRQTTYLMELMSRPIKPSEMFIKNTGMVFPVEDLKEILSDLETNDVLLNASWKADFKINDNGAVEFRNSGKQPIRDFPLKKGDSMIGCVEIFEMPKKGKDDRVPYGRYIASADVVDDDGNDDASLSLQSAFVLDTWTDRIVAEYTERTPLAAEYYERLRRLLIFYNAKVNYEQNKKGLYAYFKNHNALHLLAETPEILSERDIVSTSKSGNKKYGTINAGMVNAFGIELLLTWLMKDAGDGEKQLMHTIRSVGALKEMIMHDGEINTDRVSSLIMLMIYREDVYQRTISAKNPVKGIEQSKFWDTPFQKKKNNLAKRRSVRRARKRSSILMM